MKCKSVKELEEASDLVRKLMGEKEQFYSFGLDRDCGVTPHLLRYVGGPHREVSTPLGIISRSISVRLVGALSDMYEIHGRLTREVAEARRNQEYVDSLLKGELSSLGAKYPRPGVSSPKEIEEIIERWKRERILIRPWEAEFAVRYEAVLRCHPGTRAAIEGIADGLADGDYRVVEEVSPWEIRRRR